MASAFELNWERSRIAGIDKSVALSSLDNQLRSVVAEATETVNPFSIKVDSNSVTQAGFGNLDASFDKSVKEASDEKRKKRFALENEGYRRSKDLLQKAPLYSTVVLFSPTPR